MLDDIGIFDERYFAYLEGLDLAFRGQLRGGRRRYVRAVLTERHRIRSRRNLGALAVYSLMKRYRLPILELGFKD